MQGSVSIERMCELTRVSRASFLSFFSGEAAVEEEMEVRSAIQQIAVEHRRALRLSPYFSGIAAAVVCV